MSQSSIAYPVLAQVLLTFAVLILMGPARSQSMRENRQQLTDRDVKIGQNVWSEQATKTANNYKNQFELPVLFYTACAFALLLKQADGLMVGLAWTFAFSRLAHAAIHIGPNVVIWRGAAFLFGAAVLLVMWLLLGWRLWSGI
ncbi:MAG: MAPEG family protein [Hyphomicrobiaceae bacterium]